MPRTNRLSCNSLLDILAQSSLGAYTQLTLHWPDTLPLPQPGQRLQLHDGRILWPLRPAQNGQLDALAAAPMEASPASLVAMTGNVLNLDPEQDYVLLAEGIGLAALIHVCATRRKATAGTLALYQFSEPPAFRPRPSRFLLPDMPPEVIAAIPLLEDWGIPSRLGSIKPRAGCFEGRIEDLCHLLPPVQARRIVHLSDAQ